ncbi:uncharacterized protein [Watersipora subatra]|uniref:uncharacterized protein n=1 Tax=Watersipora subatra TaxID=2589382 RepID=UPI00355AEC55
MPTNPKHQGPPRRYHGCDPVTLAKDRLRGQPPPSKETRPGTFSTCTNGAASGSPLQAQGTCASMPAGAPTLYQSLPSGIKEQLEESDTHGLLADGTRLPFYGVIRLPVRLSKLKTEEVFIVSQISEDTILGMPFVMAHQCLMEFARPMVKVDGKPLACTDRAGKLLQNKVQLIRDLVVSARTEVAVRCTYTSVETPPPIAGTPSLKGGPAVPITRVEAEPQIPQYLQELYQAARPLCQNAEPARKLATLLTKYGSVFSTGDNDMGKTLLVEHSIPVKDGTRPIRQSSHRLGPEKEAEAKKQVQDLLARGLIEPAGGAWGSPIVLVKKRDGKW